MYNLKLTFNDNTDIDCDISMSSFSVSEIYYSDSLTQSDNSVKLKVPYTTQLASKLLETADSNTTQAFLTDDDNPIFTGYVRKTFGLSKTQRPKFISLELVSPSFLLKTKSKEDIALTNNPTIADCVNALLSAAGFDDRVTGPTDTISVFYVASGTKYSDTLDSLLLSYSYTWDFDESGSFAIYPIFNQPESAITQNFDGTNIQGTLKVDHKVLEYDGVQVNWKNVKEIENATIFKDTTNQADGYDCQIEIASDDYLGDNGEDGYFAQYDSDEGDIIYISSARLDTKYDSDGIVESLTNYPTQGLVKIHNTNNKSINITQMHIIGSGYVDCGTCESKTTDGSNLNPIDANFCYIKETAALLAQNFSNWQKYSTITIDLTSYQDFKKGSFCTVTDNWVGRFIGRITQKEWSEPKSKPLYSYHIEAIASYDPSSIKSSVKKNSSSSSPVVSIEHSVSETEVVKENVYGTVDNKIITYNGLKVKINSKNEGENTFINIGNKSTLISKPIAKSVGALTIKPADYLVTYGAKTVDGARNLIAGDWYVYIGTDDSGAEVTIPYRWNGNEFTELSSDNSNWATIIDNAKSVALSNGRPITTSSSLLYAYIKMLAVSDAMIDNLVATTAFIDKLTANTGFINKLIVKNLLATSDDNSWQLAINKTEGLTQTDENGNVIVSLLPSGKNFFKGSIEADNGTFKGQLDTITLYTKVGDNTIFSTTTPINDGYTLLKQLYNKIDIPQTVNATGTVNGQAITSVQTMLPRIWRTEGTKHNHPYKALIYNWDVYINTSNDRYKYTLRRVVVNEYFSGFGLDKIDYPTQSASYASISQQSYVNFYPIDWIGNTESSLEESDFNRFGGSTVFPHSLTNLGIYDNTKERMYIKNLTNNAPSESNRVWRDNNGFLRIT